MKRVMIMGASSGIGYAVAEALASRGVKVALAARNIAPLQQLREKYPDCVEYAEIDINRPEAVDRMHELAERAGGMDIYFHVAGIGYDNPGLAPEREAAIVNTNSTAFARMVSAAYKWMRDNNVRGQIAAVTSVAGTKGIGEFSAYSASKRMAQTYLVALEQLACKENAGIAFTDIRPGWIETPLLKEGEDYPMMMTLDEVVPLIIRAIVRKERVAVIDWRWNLLVGAWRLVPNALWVKMGKFLRF